MMFLDRTLTGEGRLAISQPTHAWVSGLLLRAWAEPLDEAVLLAAEQHDIGWQDWEVAPSFDPVARRPHQFRDVGPSVHAPMWARGVDRALAAWGAHVALLVSRHGTLIYTRFFDPRRLAQADADAVADFLRRQAALQAAWTQALGLQADALAHETGLIALSDTLSLALCGGLAAPLLVSAPGVPQSYRLGQGRGPALTVDPWPFRGDGLSMAIEARVLPPDGLADEAAMRAWLAHPTRAMVALTLAPKGLLDGAGAVP